MSPSPSLSPLKFHESEFESESQGHESEYESLKCGLESDSSPDSDSSVPNTAKK